MMGASHAVACLCSVKSGMDQYKSKIQKWWLRCNLELRLAHGYFLWQQVQEVCTRK